jgi:hypothetical protein
VWRNVCGVTLPFSLASPTALLKPFLTEATGFAVELDKAFGDQF